MHFSWIQIRHLTVGNLNVFIIITISWAKEKKLFLVKNSSWNIWPITDSIFNMRYYFLLQQNISEMDSPIGLCFTLIIQTYFFDRLSYILLPLHISKVTFLYFFLFFSCWLSSADIPRQRKCPGTERRRWPPVNRQVFLPGWSHTLGSWTAGVWWRVLEQFSATVQDLELWSATLHAACNG